jgi:hypothetical protein
MPARRDIPARSPGNGACRGRGRTDYSPLCCPRGRFRPRRAALWTGPRRPLEAGASGPVRLRFTIPRPPPLGANTRPALVESAPAFLCPGPARGPPGSPAPSGGLSGSRNPGDRPRVAGDGLAGFSGGGNATAGRAIPSSSPAQLPAARTLPLVRPYGSRCRAEGAPRRTDHGGRSTPTHTGSARAHERGRSSAIRGAPPGSSTGATRPAPSNDRATGGSPSGRSPCRELVDVDAERGRLAWPSP